MSGVQFLVCLWTLLIAQSGFVRSEIQFIKKDEGDSVHFPCATEQRNPPPFGVYLKRSWLNQDDMLFKHAGEEFTVGNDQDKNRTSVNGDPSSHSVEVIISKLTVRDTDRYYCEFVVENPSSEDERVKGKTEFFLLVGADSSGSVDRGRLETCAGGSVVLPCLPEQEGLVVEGVSLKRQRGRAPVEVLYHSKRHHSSNGPPTSSQFPAERFHLTSAPGPSGITYNLTLQQLQPEDSGRYSCQLLQHGNPDSSTSLGRQVFFVSVQGGQCSCSGSSTLFYVLSSAVVALLLLLGFVGIYLCKTRRSVRSHPQAPIYEEMAGVKPRKFPPRHLEDKEHENRNCIVKKSCSDNHYESPSGALFPRRES